MPAQPWPRRTSARCRPRPLGPFDRTTVLFGSAAASSSAAAGPPRPPSRSCPTARFPAVPTLVLAGEDDLRTPLESARRVAARIPGATLVAVPEIGPLGADTGFRAAAASALRRLLRRQAGAAVLARHGGPFLPCRRSRVRCARCRPSRRSAAGAAAPSPRSASTLADALDQLLSASAAREVRAERPAASAACGPDTCAPARTTLDAARRGVRARACACAAGSSSATARTACCA